MLKHKESYKQKLDSTVKEILDCYVYSISEYYVIINTNLRIGNNLKRSSSFVVV